VFPDGQLARVKYIAQYIRKHQDEIDVIVFCELFDQRSHEYLQHVLQTSTPFRHCTARVGDDASSVAIEPTSPNSATSSSSSSNTNAPELEEEEEEEPAQPTSFNGKPIGWRGMLSRVTSYVAFMPSRLNGGVQIFSRFPLDTTETRVFCHRVELKGTDRLARKGFAYARITLPDPKLPHVHLVGTHLQAWEDRKSVDMRLKEVAHIRRFLQGLHIPSHEPVLVAGDLNVDVIHASDDFDDMCHVLGACDLDIRAVSTPPSPSVDNLLNNMVGRDRALRTSSEDTYARLDHCLALEAHASALVVDKCTSTVWTDWKSPTPISMGVAGLRHTPFRRLHSHHLSDHFPVLTHVKLATPTKPVVVVLGDVVAPVRAIDRM